ncbi:alpha/beta-hydrolase [Xylariaceae sp. FL1272]|nr:alpha/beta-hydrolase [Xylariaceae sp. FL1272]
MSTQKPTLIFCPGAWCKPAYFKPTTDILEKKGYTCLTTSLPGCASEERSADAPSIDHGLKTDAKALRDVIIPQLDAGNDVVVICHSYGGVVTSEAVKGLDRASRGPNTGAVIYLVYVAALLIDVGSKVWPDGTPKGFVTNGDLCWKDPAATDMDVWLAGTSEEGRKLLLTSVGSHQWRCFAEPTTHDAWRRIPGTYVRAKLDLMPNMIEAAPKGHKFEEILECNGDHFAFGSAAEEVAGIIQDAAERAVANRG